MFPPDVSSVPKKGKLKQKGRKMEETPMQIIKNRKTDRPLNLFKAFGFQ